MTIGWLFDACCLEDRIILWIKTKTKTYRIKKDWQPSFYVASDDKSKLEKLQKSQTIAKHSKDIQWVKRQERVSDLKPSKLLKITANANNIQSLAKRIERLEEYGTCRIYNVDIPLEQSYLYENDLYPLGRYSIANTWKELSDIAETDYSLPELKIKTKSKFQNNTKNPKVF